MVRVRTPDELRSLMPDMLSKCERQHADCFSRIWDMQRKSEHPKYRGIEVLMQVERDARLYYIARGKSEYLGAVAMEAAKRFARTRPAEGAW